MSSGAGALPRLATGELDELRGHRILVTGSAGMLGSALRGVLARAVPEAQVSSPALDVTDRGAVMACAELRPEIILHCAALVHADRCEREPDSCHRVIVGGTENVLALAHRAGSRLFYPQSFLVFDESVSLITEGIPPRPLSVYGRAKLEAEELVRRHQPEGLVVRMGGFFGGEDRDKNFVGAFCRQLPQLLADGIASYAVGDRIWQPTFTEDLAANVLLLLAQRRTGVYHMASHGEASFYEVACAVVRELGVDGSLVIERVPGAELAKRDAAPRPPRAVLDNRRLRDEGLDRQRHWRDALAEYLARPYFRRLLGAGGVSGQRHAY